MVPTVVLYGVAQGFARGAGLLTLPLAGHAISLNDLGLYAIILTAIQIGSQVLSLGGGAAVVREGAAHAPTAHALALRMSAIALAGGIALALISLVSLGMWSQLWIYGALLSAHEAVHQLLLLAVRCLDRPWYYFSLSSLKVMAWVTTAAWLAVKGQSSLDLSDLLVLQLVVYSAVTIVLIMLVRPNGKPHNISFAAVIPYCLPLVAHSFAQWIMNSADKFIVKWHSGSMVLGQYSLAYTVASVLLVATSGLALYLPNEVIKHHIRWACGSYRLRFIMNYSAVMFLALIILLAGMELDREWFGFLRYYAPFMPVIVGFVGGGFFLVGIYYIYACFHIRRGATGVLAVQTGGIAVASLALTVLLVLAMGPCGAAVATFVTYALYAILVRRSASQIEMQSQGWSGSGRAEFATIAVTSFLMIAAGFTLSAYWRTR